MTYRVVGIGVEDAPLEYEKPSLLEAVDLAVKMASNGVVSPSVIDPDGNVISFDQVERLWREEAERRVRRNWLSGKPLG